MSDLKRPNYFTGRLLTAEDFQAEQDYHRSKAQRHNRLLHGSGVVVGLQVSVENSTAGSAIVVQPGFALDPAGREVELDERRKLPITASWTSLHVHIRYLERFVDEWPSSGTDPDASTQPRWIVETCEVALVGEPFSTDPTNPADAGVALARVIRRGRRWHLDRRFRVPCVR
jgi:hypothetical protein